MPRVVFFFFLLGLIRECDVKLLCKVG
uniref:Uncharacterized protein n=1 Tax=Arundo donax TaxID=35708 RepID=A0A0A9FE92_ARUDO